MLTFDTSVRNYAAMHLQSKQLYKKMSNENIEY